MRGLYLNVPGAADKIQTLSRLLGTKFSVVQSKITSNLDLHINYNPMDWPDGPIFFDPANRLVAAGSGWLFYGGKVGNLSEFARAFASAHAKGQAHAVAGKIEAGAFLILVVIGGKPFLITDPFGLHPHYFRSGADPIQLAPAPSFLDSGVQAPDLVSILSKQNHLFGNCTSYEGIHRLDPGAVIREGETAPYFDYRPGRFAARGLKTELSLFLDRFGMRKRLLPISGGLDSRFPLACGRFDFGYTLGPAGTGDRPVARKFRHSFREYKEFSLLDLRYHDRYRRAAEIMFGGLCPRPFVELLPAYSYLQDIFGGECTFCDGFAGDVLQRGLYLTHGGLGGSLAKLFPILTTRRFSPLRLLKARYLALSAREFELLAAEYEQRTRPWDLDPARKFVLFELLYGRGSRHIVNGGTIMSNQYFTSIQPYLAPAVFRTLFALDPLESVTYANLRRIWAVVPRELANVPTYSGFKPVWNPHVSRTVMLVVKGLGKLRLYKRSVSYEDELGRIRWE
jgi:hypothetical protein